MPPTLVVANAAYTLYPGGVIALRASDWMGGARGTLSSEADARSASGTVVRDSQQVTSVLRTDPNGAFQEADDTLTIDFSALPLEIGMTYQMFFSLLIEGDWDSSNTETTRGATQERFLYACALRLYGDSVNFLSDTDTADLVYKPRLIDSYRIVGGIAIGDIVGDEVIHLRAYAQNGTTIEWLLDQIYLLPYVTSGTKAGEWRASDFKSVGGSQGSSGAYSLVGDWVDGADGGDDNGKFTWHPLVANSPTEFSGEDGGGDYQRKADSATSEYMARVVPDDFYLLENSEKDMEAAAYCYGAHGPFYIPQQTWTDDDFGRTVGDGNFAGAIGHFVAQNWGHTPEGFAWRSDGGSGPDAFGKGRACWVDGSRGIMEVRGEGATGFINSHIRAYGGEAGPNTGAELKADNAIISGEFQAVSTAGSPAGLTLGTRIGTGSGLVLDDRACPFILFNLQDGSWTLGYGNAGAEGTIAGPFTLSGYSLGDSVGFKLEVKRHLLRVRIWDASGAEPGTWDFEDFRPLLAGVGPYKDYPYLTGGIEDLNWSIREWDLMTGFIWLESSATPTDQVQFYFDNFKFENDPYGTNESAFASIEQPEGSEIGQIEIPAGCQHLVYWGVRDWTELDAGSPYLNFSAKVWNDTAAAELQRSEAVWWWFRSLHAFIIPMNWRSSTREGGFKRILKGNTP